MPVEIRALAYFGRAARRIEVFYNRTRRHSSLGMMSPAAYEKLHVDNTAAA